MTLPLLNDRAIVRRGYDKNQKKGPLVHPSEPAYPCCLPALGRFTRYTPHERLPRSLANPDGRPRADPHETRATGVCILADGGFA
ncbi:hypothetical protein GCM10010172_29230 [Paractinoplanes ferrugineus]|uniref:Uncharacterized protein n=1 Tax=Paractinoplanes ferrugineus TaxID=113564 RepID=A0A919IUQ3_9ACTN|nr:hypothetical protein Afe05nite_00070 [Actinoplanes ferrugineus]